MRTKRTLTVYGILLAVWLLVAVWQVYAHKSAQKTAQETLENSASDISYILSTSIKPQWPFRPFLTISDLEPSLNNLVADSRGNLLAIALLNENRETLASAGESIDVEYIFLAADEPPDWSQASVALINPVDLGLGESEGATTQSAPLVLDDENTSPGFGIGRSRGMRGAPPEMRSNPEYRRLREQLTALNQENQDLRESFDRFQNPEIRTRNRRNGVQTSFKWERRRGLDIQTSENRESVYLYFTTPYERNNGRNNNSSDYRGNSSRNSNSQSTQGSSRRNGGGDSGRGDGNRGGGESNREGQNETASDRDQLSSQTANVDRVGINFQRRGYRSGMFRPRFLTEDEIQELRPTRGLHGFILLMSTESYHAENLRDFWLRLAMVALALAAVIGLGLAWRNMARSDRLQLCLVRASEMNVHLREMNIAAAGLAHETRNPLNIVRGLAHMIGKTANVSKEITKQSSEITEEVDRVTGRLNEFIDYSKPHEAKFATTNLNAIIQDVERTLESDQQEKGIQFELHGPELTVEADQALLRQVLFNLLLNSIQAVERDGRIEVHVQKDGASEAALEIRDNGPGVPAEARENIFRPYFTTTKGGTGLGLAVVRQIVLAHRWEINYLPGNNGGSRFRISGLKLA